MPAKKPFTQMTLRQADSFVGHRDGQGSKEKTWSNNIIGFRPRKQSNPVFRVHSYAENLHATTELTYLCCEGDGRVASPTVGRPKAVRRTRFHLRAIRSLQGSPVDSSECPQNALDELKVVRRDAAADGQRRTTNGPVSMGRRGNWRQ